MNVLDIVLFLPLLGFLAILALPRSSSRVAALAISLGVFALSLGLIPGVLHSPGQFTYETNVEWISHPSIRYHVAVDGLSLWLVILSTFLTPIAVLVSWNSISRRAREFFAFLILLEFGLIGVFAALDLILFYVFWEVSLVPMYFLIGIWGHERRIYAAVKFFLYTMAGSVLMLAAIIYLQAKTGSFDYSALLGMVQSGRLLLGRYESLLLFLAFFVAFAIKVPLFPLHTWLPDAHVEAPTAGSVMLAAVMLKMGCYGLIRFCLPLFPNTARTSARWIAVLAIIGIVYGALVALVQPNMKKLVAYSSVSHLGFVVLGIFCFNEYALDGAVYQMLGHGISTGALFVLVGMLYDRRHSLAIEDYRGASRLAPWLATAFMIAALASIGLPLLCNFVGEFLVLQGAATTNFQWAAFAALGVILSACYMLWLYQRVFMGRAPDGLQLPDLGRREVLALVPLILMMVWMGVAPMTFLRPVSASNRVTLDRSRVNVEQMVRAFPLREVASAR